MSDRYAPSDKPRDKKLAEAVQWSTGRSGPSTIANTNTDDATSRKAYEDNYEAIFGKKDIPHGT